MKKSIVYILAFIGLFCILNTTYAQGFEAFVNSTIDKDDIASTLIPLTEMLDKAEHNAPILKMYEAQISRNKAKVTNVRREWKRYLGFEANARYGLLDNFVLSDSETGSTINTSKSYNSEETRYYVGFFARVPFSALFDNSDIEFSRNEIEMVKQQRLARLKELREDVIIYYNNVLKYHGGLILRNQMCESYKVQVMRAEKDFINGNIDIAEYARLNEMLTKANIELEAIKVEFNTSLLLLQELVGSPIILKNNNLE